MKMYEQIEVDLPEVAETLNNLEQTIDCFSLVSIVPSHYDGKVWIIYKCYDDGNN